MKEITHGQFRFIRSLHHKKYRDQERCFLVEGEKGVNELFRAGFDVATVVCTAPYWPQYEGWMAQKKGLECYVATEANMARLGTLKTNNSALAVVHQRPYQLPIPSLGEWILVLDDIRDPGNLGTIVRTADWFGIRWVVASAHTVELYNPKVIHATMGSFTRVQFGYTSLVDYLSTVSLPVYGMFLQGDPIATAAATQGGIIVVGNESKGISDEVASWVTNRICVPRLGAAESLNAAIATGIVLYEFARQRKG